MVGEGVVKTLKRLVGALILILNCPLIMAPSAFATTQQQRVLFKTINHKRQKIGAGNLKWTSRIEQAAKKHSNDMAAKAYLAHRSPNGGTLANRLKDNGVVRWNAAAENIVSAPNAKAALTKWLGSAGNRRKMLNKRYTHIGIGIADGGPEGKVYTLNLVQNPKLKKTIPTEAAKIVKLLNAKRREIGARPLHWRFDLANVAKRHSADMINNNYFSHRSLDGRSLVDRLFEGNIRGWNRAGENIAGTNSGERAFELWMNSDSHRENMLDPKYERVGVGIAGNGSFEMFTMDLIARP
jgi:uncharacterized protein YkwD